MTDQRRREATEHMVATVALALEIELDNFGIDYDVEDSVPLKLAVAAIAALQTGPQG